MTESNKHKVSSDHVKLYKLLLLLYFLLKLLLLTTSTFQDYVYSVRISIICRFSDIAY